MQATMPSAVATNDLFLSSRDDLIHLMQVADLNQTELIVLPDSHNCDQQSELRFLATGMHPAIVLR